MAQIYLTFKSNNETYTIKETLQPPDKEEFLKAMEKETASMIQEKIWEMVPRSEMIRHYDDQRRNGKEINRQQIMTILTFKRKRHPDGSFIV